MQGCTPDKLVYHLFCIHREDLTLG